MKTFAGLSRKEKKANRIIGGVFAFMLTISILIALSTPKKNELLYLEGVIKHIACEDSQVPSRLNVTVAGDNSNEISFNQNTQCTTLTTDSLMNKKAYIYYSEPSNVYEAILDTQTIISYEESATNQRALPLGV